MGLDVIDVRPVDVAIVGGGTGGVAAALGALRGGARVLLTEESPWLGGQLTSQGVPPDEHPWIENVGSTSAYRGFRSAVRDMYRRCFPMVYSVANSGLLNPGLAWVSPIAHPPVVAKTVIDEMLLPHIVSGHLQIHTSSRPVSAEVDGDRVLAVHIEGDAGNFVCAATYFLDATESGDLLEMAHVEHVTGSESREVTGEPHASHTSRPSNMQAITHCLAVGYHAGEDHRIERPARYDRWRSFRPPNWPGPLLSWVAPDPRSLRPRDYAIYVPERDDETATTAVPEWVDLWSYRRIVASANHPLSSGVHDVTVLNWPMNDYTSAPVIGVPAGARYEHLAEARELTLSLLYWLQVEAPRLDGGIGYPELRPRGDLMGTSDGLALRAYVREGRRIVAELTITEQQIAAGVRTEHRAESFEDSIGTGAYRIDLHPTTGGDPYIDIATFPFEIPLRALLPVRVDNLLPAAKNIGTTHITNGCYRVHPVEWTIGEAAGRLAAYCVDRSVLPRHVASSRSELSAFQNVLVKAGFDLHWTFETGAL